MDALLLALAKSIYYIRSKGSSLQKVLVHGAFVNEGGQLLTVCFAVYLFARPSLLTLHQQKLN